MADTSERIIILSALLLVIIIVWAPPSQPPIVSLSEIQIEVETDNTVYLLNEDVEVKVYFYNEKPYAVRINTNIGKVIVGYTPERGPSPASTGHGYPIDYSEIPSNSRIEFHSTTLTPKYTGEYVISCLGANKTVLILDPDKEVPMPSFDISDLLDPELALSHGFRGYIDISYVSKIPDRVNVTSEKMINYTIQLELIPHVPEFTETEVLLAPENERAQFGILSSGANLNEYIHYSPNGFILLRVDEPRNVIMILSVPEGLRSVSEYPQDLLGIGIFADVPIASAYGAGIHRIPRDEYAWITATVLTVEPSPILDIVKLSSEDTDIPRSLFKAIDKALPEGESEQEGEQITDVPIGERRLAISIVEAESIIHYFGEELEKDRLYYEYYVSYVDSIFSVLIQFHLPDPTS